MKGKLTFTTKDHVLLVVANGVIEHFLLFTALTRHQDILLDFKLLAARPTAEHRNMTLWAKISLKYI